MVLETKIWAHGVLMVTGVSLTLDLLNWQSNDVCILIHMFTHTHTHTHTFWVYQPVPMLNDAHAFTLMLLSLFRCHILAFSSLFVTSYFNNEKPASHPWLFIYLIFNSRIHLHLFKINLYSYEKQLSLPQCSTCGQFLCL